MLRRRVWAREHTLSRMVLATCLSWMRAVSLVSCVLSFCSPFAVDGGAGLGEGGRGIRRRVLEGGACVAYEDAHEVARRVPHIVVGRREGGSISRSS